jgi:hypothetical protein
VGCEDLRYVVDTGIDEDALEEDFGLDFWQEAGKGHGVSVNLDRSGRLVAGIDEDGKVGVLMLTVDLGIGFTRCHSTPSLSCRAMIGNTAPDCYFLLAVYRLILLPMGRYLHVETQKIL